MFLCSVLIVNFFLICLLSVILLRCNCVPNKFIYLSSLQSSDGQCRPDVTCRIGLACAVMTSLKRIWSDKRVTLDTKLRIYETLVLSVLLYAADTWTLLSADVRTVDAFHQNCLRQLLGVR